MLNVSVGPDSTLESLGHRPVITVAADATIGDVARTMRRANVSLVLIDGCRSILTERDLTNALAEGRGADDFAATAASTSPVIVRDRLTVMQAAELMVAQQIRHLIVEDGQGDIESVVSMRDVVSVLLQAMDPALSIFLQRVVTEHSEIWLG
jgi:CBS domain-containing protein